MVAIVTSGQVRLKVPFMLAIANQFWLKQLVSTMVSIRMYFHLRETLIVPSFRQNLVALYWTTPVIMTLLEIEK